MRFPFRVGLGWDRHALVDGRPLILGGVRVPFERGLLGHSDGDVVAHAVGDALLGAARLSDLGSTFPPGDPKWKGVSSLLLLERIRDLLAEARVRVVNVDVVVVAQEPRLAAHVEQMQERLTAAMAAAPGTVLVKPKSPEGVGGLGRSEGIEATAVALVYIEGSESADG